MASERAKLRPYPRTRKSWAKEVDGIRRHLGNLEGWRGAMGDKWVERQREYYQGRLDFLIDKGAPKVRRKAVNRGRNLRGLR